MKRSKINAVIRDMQALIDEKRFCLPPFAYWTEAEWQAKSAEYDEIRDNMLGWDLTDFGSGAFEKQGLLLFTVRNGNLHNAAYPKPYAEKIMLVKENQITPYHFHWSKMEDIINRGGNDVYITVYNGDKDGKMLDTDVVVNTDGKVSVVPAGTKVRLTPGESITITPYMYHDFEVLSEGGKVLLGEVSMCNDDQNDNRFYQDGVGRFPAIDEDEVPYRLLCNEYPVAK